MDLSNIIPRETHAALRWLGDIKQEWWLCQKLENFRTLHQINFNLLKSLGYEKHRKILKVFLETNRENTVYWTYCFAKMLSDGPKIFRPTVEQFDSMCHVELHIPVSMYCQPFPTMVVEVPEESKEKLCQKFDIKIPPIAKYVLLNTMQREFGLCVFGGQPFAGGEDTDMFHLFHDRLEIETIEQAITTRINTFGNINNYYYGEIVLRSCLNLMLMLMHYGHKDGGPLHPKEYDKHRKNCKAKHKEKQTILAAGDFRTIEMIQNIVIRQEKTNTHSEGEGSGKEISTHWRRGHWRTQRFGEKLAQNKMILIKPMLIRADRAVGHIGNSQTSYRTKLF